MQLNIGTDYAIRVILMLSDSHDWVSASGLSQTLVIPQNYLRKVLARLKTAGLVEAVLGTNGGYQLNKPAEEVTFQMVFDAMNDTVKINRCLETDHYCSRDSAETCPVHAFYAEIQEWLDERFANTSIADLTRKGELPDD